MIDSEGAITRQHLQLARQGIYRRDFFAYEMILCIPQIMIVLLRENEIESPRLPCQRTKAIALFLGFQYIACLLCIVVIGLGRNKYVATSGRTVGTDMQSCSSPLPTAAVLLDLADTAMTKRKTEGIDDIDILPVVLHIDRTILTAGNRVVPIVIGCRMRHAVLLRYGRYTGVGDELKYLRHTEVFRQI